MSRIVQSAGLVGVREGGRRVARVDQDHALVLECELDLVAEPGQLGQLGLDLLVTLARLIATSSCHVRSATGAGAMRLACPRGS